LIGHVVPSAERGCQSHGLETALSTTVSVSGSITDEPRILHVASNSTPGT
jgi:hypothetical protein